MANLSALLGIGGGASGSGSGADIYPNISTQTHLAVNAILFTLVDHTSGGGIIDRLRISKGSLSLLQGAMVKITRDGIVTMDTTTLPITSRIDHFDLLVNYAYATSIKIEVASKYSYIGTQYNINYTVSRRE